MKYAEPNITGGDITWVNRAMSSGWLTQGAIVETFEKQVAAYVGAKYAVAFNSATSALFAAYSAVFPPGAKVIMPPITFVATANAAVNAQLEPVFTDHIFGENVVQVHMAGRYCAFEGKRVVEDAAHALGSSGPDGRIGNCKRSDVTVFSTHAIKNITTGEGGIATTNSRKHYENMRLLRDHGRKNGKCLVAGWNFRMNEMQAALGVSQMTRIEHMKERRQEIFATYKRELEAIIDTPAYPEYETFWHLFVVHTPKRDRLQKHLAKAGIQTAINYPMVPDQPAYKKSRSYNCDLGREWAKTCLSLPMHNNLKDEDVRQVCEEVKAWRLR